MNQFKAILHFISLLKIFCYNCLSEIRWKNLCFYLTLSWLYPCYFVLATIVLRYEQLGLWNDIVEVFLSLFILSSSFVGCKWWNYYEGLCLYWTTAQAKDVHTLLYGADMMMSANYLLINAGATSVQYLTVMHTYS